MYFKIKYVIERIIFNALAILIPIKGNVKSKKQNAEIE